MRVDRLPGDFVRRTEIWRPVLPVGRATRCHSVGAAIAPGTVELCDFFCGTFEKPTGA